MLPSQQLGVLDLDACNQVGLTITNLTPAMKKEAKQNDVRYWTTDFCPLPQKLLCVLLSWYPR